MPFDAINFVRSDLCTDVSEETSLKFAIYILDLGGENDGEGKFLLDPVLCSAVIETKKLKLVTIYTGITYGSSDIPRGKT